MVGPSKILTVSYGTFSCTLEGFDNPFSTMRGIAEYFRDLAADDRYFGAEPPIPDAEMLHRIAQDDAQKRVVAHMESNGVTLRQVDDGNAEMTDAPGLVAVPKAKISDPFVDEPADTVALNEPSEVQTESVAAKLARIRAVVSHDNVATDSDDQAKNAEDAKDDVFSTAPISAAFEDTAADFIEDNPDEDTVAFKPDLPEEETDAPNSAQNGAQNGAQNSLVADDAASAAALTQEPAADDGDKSGVAEASDDALSQKPDAALAETGTEPVHEQVNAAAIAQFMGKPDAVDTEEEGDDTGALDDTDRSSISRVVKMRRADFDTAIDAGGQGDSQPGAHMQPSKDAPASERAEKTPDSGGSSLSAEDEAELMANLAQVQRKADAEERSEKMGRAMLENKDIESSGEAVSRILDVTNSELAETEGTRRRSAIAHLKAAVAATRADKFLTSKRQKEEEEEISQYRDDLAKVVKPRRLPDSGKSARQAPLMLVSEQRVDVSAQVTSLSVPTVLPRRISAEEMALSDKDKENIFLEKNTLAEFAAEMGARELPDLLEAAAAYSAYIQGQAHFSRPQIMQAVAGIREEEFSREEGLRSFGLLLRRGRIKKLRRGQFVIADTTRFHPQPRAVGQ